MTLDTPQDSNLSNDFATIPDVSLDAIADRVIPRQVASGLDRGAQVIIGTAGLPKVLSGNQKTFGLGFYVAKDGKDVTAVTNANDFIFNSNQNIYKIIATIPLTLTFTRSSATFATYTISAPHGQTFTPSFIPNIAIDSLLTALPVSTRFESSYILAANVAGTFTPYGQIYVTIDSTNVYLQCDISTIASGTYTNTASVDILQRTFS